MATKTHANDTLVKTVRFVRVFTVIAMLVGGMMELWSSEIFSTPIEQIGFATIAGILGATIAKAIHFA
ncbi:hypothetical protein [Brucella intermedia]|uniref:hypothetical protein n=1 Tax=Brucella intermedia TaxID=94625 RepID=UPI0034CF1E69